MKNKTSNTIETGNNANLLLYAVLKMQKTVAYTDPLSGREVITEISGCAGYMPIFNTMEEAIENSCDGKFQVMPIRC